LQGADRCWVLIVAGRRSLLGANHCWASIIAGCCGELTEQALMELASMELASMELASMELAAVELAAVELGRAAHSGCLQSRGFIQFFGVTKWLQLTEGILKPPRALLFFWNVVSYPPAQPFRYARPERGGR
jgi:hypothetical protein